MKKHTLLIFVLFVALLIRVIGTVPGHNYYHPDEPMSYGSATDMFVYGDLNPRRYDYPAGVPLLHYGLYKTFFLPIVYIKEFVFHPHVLFTALERGQQFFQEQRIRFFGQRDLDALFWSRIITALLGFFTVALIYLIGRELFSEVIGLTSAAFLSVNYRHVLSSHLALSDIPNTVFALFSFYTTVLLLRKNTLERYIVSGIAIGLSLSMKYQVYPLLPFFFVQTWWAIRKHSLRELFNAKFFLSLVFIAAVFIITNPYLFLNLEKSVATIHMVSARYQAGIWRFNAYPVFFLYHWGIGIIPSIVMIAGLAISLFIFPFQTLLLLTYVAPFLVTFLYYLGGGTYVRNFTTVIPFLCLFAGVFVSSMDVWIKRMAGIPIPQSILVAFVFLLSLAPFKDSLALDLAYTQPWAREQLATWVMNNVPDNSDIVNDNTAVPSNPNKPLNLTPWSRDIGNSVTTLMIQNRDFAVLNVNWNQAYFFDWFAWPFKRLFSYTDTPYSYLRESYHGLLIDEYFRYSVKEVYKSYQAPDDAYLVLKIPQFPQSSGGEIRAFQFTQGLEGWRFFDFRNGIHEAGITWNASVGHDSQGSLEFVGNKPDINFTRAVSPFIPANPGNVYTMVGYVKTDEIRSANGKDGFFRLDFYPDASAELLQRNSLRVAVSDALFGSDSWSKEEIITTAPPGTRYLTVSFQRSDPGSSHYWIDDIRLFESNTPLKDRFPQIPYLHPTMPDNILYPNSIY